MLSSAHIRASPDFLFLESFSIMRASIPENKSLTSEFVPTLLALPLTRLCIHDWNTVIFELGCLNAVLELGQLTHLKVNTFTSSIPSNFMEILQKCPLRKLQLRLPMMTTKVEDQLLDLCHQCPSLTKVIIIGEFLPNEVEQALKQNMTRETTLQDWCTHPTVYALT